MRECGLYRHHHLLADGYRVEIVENSKMNCDGTMREKKLETDERRKRERRNGEEREREREERKREREEEGRENIK